MFRTIVYAITTLDGLTFIFFVTSLNPYVTSVGGSRFYLGVLGSVTALCNLIWHPIGGGLSDSIGRKKLLIFCNFTCVVANLVPTISDSLSLFFISRMLATMGVQKVVLMKAIVDDTIKDKKKKETMLHMMQTILGVSYIGGALIGGFLCESENGFKKMFTIISAFFAINTGLSCLLPYAKVKRSVKSSSKFKETLKNLTTIDWEKYWALLYLKMTVDLVNAIFFFNLNQIPLLYFGIKGKTMGYVISSVGILRILSTVFMSKIKSKLFRNDDLGLKRIFSGILLQLYAIVGLGLSPNFVFFYLHLIPMPMVRVLCETTFTEVILDRAEDHEKGKILGTFESSVALSGLVAPLISGILSEKFGNFMCLLFCAVPLTAGAVVAKSQHTKYKKQ